MSSDSILVLAMILAFASAVLGILVDKITYFDPYKGIFVFIVAFLALLSGIFNLVGSKQAEKDNKTDIKQIYDENQNGLNEAFGLMSKRTVEQFLADKVPNNLSHAETMQIIKQSLSKYIEENIATMDISTNKKEVVKYDPNMEWYNGDSSTYGCYITSNTKFKRNYPIQKQNVSTFWDANLWHMSTPNDHKYISVIVDDGTLTDSRFVTKMLSEKSRDLYLKYSRWYSAIRNFQTTHQTYSHIIILVMNDKRDKTMDEMIKDEMNLWAGYERETKMDNSELSLVIYNMSDLKNIKPTFE